MWSNYNITGRCLKVVKTRERRLNIEAKLKEAMHEGAGEENEMEWWHEWSNDVVGPVRLDSD